MGDLIEKYIAIGIQYCHQEKTVSAEGTQRNLRRMKDHVDWAYEQFSYSFPIKFIGFPECCATGYPAGMTMEALAASEEIPGPVTDEIGNWAREYECFIGFGMASKVPEFPTAAFNTSVMMDDEGNVCLRYHKTNPWIPDEFWQSPVDLLDVGWPVDKYPLFPVARTKIGNWGTYICHDAMTPEPCRQLAFNGAEILYHPIQFMDPWVMPPLDYVDLQTRWNSIVNVAYHVTVNGAWTPHQVPPYGYQGGSCITDFEGRKLSACPQSAVESMCMSIIDIRAVREYRRTMMTHNGLMSFRGEAAYDYFKRKNVFPQRAEIAEDPNYDMYKSRESVRKIMTDFYDDYYKDAVQ